MNEGARRRRPLIVANWKMNLGRTDEALALVERGRAAEESGKPNVAVIYYRMAANRTQGQQKDELLAKLHAIMNADSLAAEPR